MIYGQYYNASAVEYKQGAPIYYKADDEYKISDYKQSVEYDPNYQTFLPRMWSSSLGMHSDMQITGSRPNQKPSFADNLYFMFSHQIGHMYLRYFMFNFAGRESDIQDADWLGPFASNKDVPETIISNKEEISIS